MTDIKAFLSKDPEGRICATLQCGSIVISRPLPDDLARASPYLLRDHFESFIPGMLAELREIRAHYEKTIRKKAKAFYEKGVAQDHGGTMGEEHGKDSNVRHLRPVE